MNKLVIDANIFYITCIKFGQNILMKTASDEIDLIIYNCIDAAEQVSKILAKNHQFPHLRAILLRLSFGLTKFSIMNRDQREEQINRLLMLQNKLEEELIKQQLFADNPDKITFLCWNLCDDINDVAKLMNQENHNLNENPDNLSYENVHPDYMEEDDYLDEHARDNAMPDERYKNFDPMDDDHDRLIIAPTNERYY